VDVERIGAGEGIEKVDRVLAPVSGEVAVVASIMVRLAPM
jgi:hypothetical protein